jgi:hypothetical protein
MIVVRARDKPPAGEFLAVHTVLHSLMADSAGRVAPATEVRCVGLEAVAFPGCGGRKRAVSAE